MIRIPARRSTRPGRRLARATAGIALAAVAVAPALSIAARATTTTSPTTAVLSISIATTAPLATVTVNSGWLAGFHVVSTTGGATGQEMYWQNGVQVTGAPLSGATVVMKVLYSEANGVNPLVFTVDKTVGASTTVTVVNQSVAGHPFTVFSTKDGPQVVTPMQVSLTRSQVFGSSDATLPVADHRHLVIADYYPWFASTSWSDPTLYETPAQPYDVWNSADVDAMTKQARANGIDGFAVSYSGSSGDISAFNIAAQAAASNSGVITALIETGDANALHSSAVPSDPSIVVDWLSGLLTNPSPAFLRAADGVPIVFVYDMNRLTPAQWQSVEAQMTAAGHPVHLMGDGGYPTYTGVEWGYAAYRPSSTDGPTLTANNRWSEVALRGQAAVDPTSPPKAFAATVEPGYNDQNLRGPINPVISRNGGAQYATDWDAALAANPDFVLVTSWNEYYEGTEVQPGTITGNQALLQTGQFGAQFKAS